MPRAHLVSPRVSVPPVTPMVSHVSGVGVVGGADAEGGVGGVTVDGGVRHVDGRCWCRCWFWVWVCTRAVTCLLWALLAGLPAGDGGVCRLLVLWVLGGLSSFQAEGAAGDVSGAGAAGDAMVSLGMTLVRVPQVRLVFALGLGFSVGVAGDASQ